MEQHPHRALFSSKGFIIDNPWTAEHLIAFQKELRAAQARGDIRHMDPNFGENSRSSEMRQWVSEQNRDLAHW
jgi:hypothetical protein